MFKTGDWITCKWSDGDIDIAQFGKWLGNIRCAIFTTKTVYRITPDGDYYTLNPHIETYADRPEYDEPWRLMTDDELEKHRHIICPVNDDASLSKTPVIGVNECGSPSGI